MDWGKIVQSMLYEVETDYVFIFMEDFKLCNFDKDYSKNNKVVSDIYFDSINGDKHKLNMKRTVLTDGY